MDDKVARAIEFQERIQSYIAAAAERAKQNPRKIDSVDLDVTFNLRINKQLKDEFERLCKANHTNMSREVKRYMSLAVSADKLI